MIKKNSIIFHKKYGFIKVKTIHRGGSFLAKVGTSKKEIELVTFPHQSMRLIPINILNSLVDFSLSKKFDSGTKARAKSYLNFDSIYDMNYENEEFTAYVKGTDTYRVSVDFKRKTFFCTCPVNGACKHVYAFVRLLCDQLLDLDYLDSENEPINELKGKESDSYYAIRYFIDGYPSQEVILEFSDFLETYNISNRKKFIVDLFSAIKKHNVKSLLIQEAILSMLLIYFPYYTYEFEYDRFASATFNLIPSIYRYCLNARSYDRNYNRDHSCSITYAYIYNVINNKIDNFFDFFDIKSSYESNEFVKKYFYQIFMDNFNLDMNCPEPFYKAAFLAKNPLLQQYSLMFINSFVGSDIIDIASAISKDEFMCLNGMQFAYAYPYSSNSYGLVSYRSESLTEEEGVILISGVIKNRYVKNQIRSEIKENLDNLTRNRFIKILFNDHHNYNYEPKYENLLNNSYSEVIYPKGITLEDIMECSDISFDIILEKTNVLISGDWTLKNGETIISFEGYDKHTYFKDCFDYIDTKDELVYLEFLCSYIKKLPTFNDKYIATKKLQEEAKMRAKYEKALNCFEVAQSKITNDLVTDSDNKTYRIEYRFFLTEDREESMYKYPVLDIRFGLDKLYAVTNIGKFISFFEYETFHKYGKSLALKHSFNNISAADKERIIKIRSLLEDPYYSSNRYVYLKTPLAVFLFDSFVGESVIINEEHYIFSEEFYEVKATLNKDYRFKLNISKDIEYIRIANSIYFLNKTDRIIYRCKKSKVVDNLIHIEKACGNTNLKHVINEFSSKIYSLYHEHINVAEEIKQDIKLPKLLFKTYFDLEDKNIITTFYRIFKDDNELNIKSLELDTFEQLQLIRYENAVKTMGFIDGKITDEDKFLNFFNIDFTEFKNISEVYLSDTLSEKKLSRFIPPSFKIVNQDSMFTVFSEDSIYSEEELALLLSAIKRKKKYIELQGGRIIYLDSEESRRYIDEIEELDIDRQHALSRKELPIFKCLSIYQSYKDIKENDTLSKMIDEIANFKSANVELPDIKADLRPYQLEGYNWLKILEKYSLGGVLADDMGLGKTLQVITLLASQSSKEPSLIVAPKSLIFNWISEFNKFAPYLKVKSIYGSKDNRKSIINNLENNTIYLTSYDSLKLDIDDYKNSVFNYVILDEAQYIKNLNALKTKSVKQIKSKHHLALTGTPIENDIFDLYSIFDFVMSGYLPSLTKFKTSYEDENFQKDIAKRISPFILRRTKRDVLKDLPPKFERIITTSMEKEQRKLYDAHVYEAKNILNQGGKSFDVLYLLTRLRQICVDPRTYLESYKGESCKFELLKQLLNEYISNGHKILVFSQFVTALEIVKDYLNENNINYFKITGETNAERRIEYVNEFNNNDEYKVFLISLKAGGNGLNLVGADTVIHLDPWWNVSAENQASDRAHRIGQTKNVEIIKLIVEDSIEQRVLELQNMKKDLIERLISDDDSSITKITLKDLYFILGKD